MISQTVYLTSMVFFHPYITDHEMYHRISVLVRVLVHEYKYEYYYFVTHEYEYQKFSTRVLRVRVPQPCCLICIMWILILVRKCLYMESVPWLQGHTGAIYDDSVNSMPWLLMPWLCKEPLAITVLNMQAKQMFVFHKEVFKLSTCHLR